MRKEISIDEKVSRLIDLGVYGFPYIEYYSHAQSDCFKSDRVDTKYSKETIVLCKVVEGFTKSIDMLLKSSQERIDFDKKMKEIYP